MAAEPSKYSQTLKEMANVRWKHKKYANFSHNSYEIVLFMKCDKEAI